MMDLRFITSGVRNAYFKINLILSPSFLLFSCEAVAFAGGAWIDSENREKPMSSSLD